MKRNFFTLTYTNSVLRLVKITGKNIDSVSSANIPAGIINDGKIERLKMFAELVNELRIKAKPKRITASEVITAIPEEKVFLKIIEIPKMPIEKVNSAITYQLESLIPFKLKEIYFNWKIIGSKSDKLIILIAVCEKKIVDSLFEALILAKLKPLIITFPSAGLANLLGQGNQLSVIVDLSRKNNISLIVAKNGNVHFSTSRHIDDTYKGLERIIQDTINYYKQKYVNENIFKVMVFGPPELEQIEERLKKTVSENTKVGDAEDIKIIRNIKPEYIVYIDNLGLGLSLEALSLLPPEIRENAKNEGINYRLSTILNYFILLLIFIIIIYGFVWGKIYYDILNVSKDYSQLQETETTFQQEQLESKINQFNQKIEIIKSVPLAASIKPSFFQEIISVANENITLKEIAVEENKNVKIKGIAKNRNDLIIFKDKLNSLDTINPITLPITALEKKEEVEFELTTSKK